MYQNQFFSQFFSLFLSFTVIKIQWHSIAFAVLGRSFFFLLKRLSLNKLNQTTKNESLFLCVPKSLHSIHRNESVEIKLRSAPQMDVKFILCVACDLALYFHRSFHCTRSMLRLKVLLVASHIIIIMVYSCYYYLCQWRWWWWWWWWSFFLSFIFVHFSTFMCYCVVYSLPFTFYFIIRALVCCVFFFRLSSFLRLVRVCFVCCVSSFCFFFVQRCCYYYSFYILCVLLFWIETSFVIWAVCAFPCCTESIYL